jgi:hypothetical protein
VRHDGRFSPTDSLRAITIVTSSFGCLFSALVPLVLLQFELQFETIWRASGGIALLSALPISAYLLRQERRITSGEGTTADLARKIVNGTVAAINLSFFAGLLFGLFGSAAPAVYLLALVLGLASGAASFVSLALSRLL